MSPSLSLALVAGMFLTVAALERIPALQFTPSPFLRRYLATDAAWYLVATAANVIAAFVFLPQLSRLAIPGVTDAVRALPWFGQLALAIVVYDCAAFAVHVCLHRSEALWSVHKVHHSSRHLDWLATTRAHMFENFVRQVAAQVPLFALGMPAWIVASALIVYAGFALIGHSNLRLGGPFVETVFITPRLHRLHHVPATSQKNLGTILTIWDRLSGRFLARDTTADQAVGVPGELDEYPQRFLAAFRQPFKEARLRRVTSNPGATSSRGPARSSRQSLT